MKILAFDTALRACSVAVWVDGQIRGQRFEERSRGHAEVLIPMISEVCATADVEMTAFDRLAVTVGPGTFAGVRIGIAAARGFAVSLSVPVVGVTTLETVAAGATSHFRAGDSHMTVVFDARRGQVYVQSFSPTLKPLSQPQAMSSAQLVDALPPGPGILIGDGVSVLGTGLTRARPDLRPIAGDAQPDAVIVGRLSVDRVPSPPGSGAPRPLYLRPPNAKLPAAPMGSS